MPTVSLAEAKAHLVAALTNDVALHLAACADDGATMCTLDQRLGEAGSMVGVATIVL